MSELKSIQDEVDINGLLSLFAKNIVTILSLSGAFAIIFYVYSIFLEYISIYIYAVYKFKLYIQNILSFQYILQEQ